MDYSNIENIDRKIISPKTIDKIFKIIYIMLFIRICEVILSCGTLYTDFMQIY